MSNRRRQFKEMETLLVVIRQGGTIPCRCCGQPITEQDILTGNVEKEHIHEIALDGPDTPDNCAFSHKAKPCHATVTHGNGATVAGSSRHRIKKATDPKRIEKFVVVKLGPQAPIPPAMKLPDLLVADKCRGCGEFKDDCKCPAPPQRTGFQRRFA